MKNLVEFIGKSLASHPEEVVVDVREKGRELVYTCLLYTSTMGEEGVSQIISVALKQEE